MPRSWKGHSGSLMPISDDSSNDPITGMWHATFTAMGNEVGPPDNTPIDNALVVFHSDGTEIMNFGAAAAGQQFLSRRLEEGGQVEIQGESHPMVWQRHYQRTERDRESFGADENFREHRFESGWEALHGRFTLDAYDTAGNQVAHIVGVISATRVNTNTSVPDLL